MSYVSLRDQTTPWSVEMPTNESGKAGWKLARTVRAGDSSDTRRSRRLTGKQGISSPATVCEMVMRVK
jgi:hypothetical protein